MRRRGACAPLCALSTRGARRCLRCRCRAVAGARGGRDRAHRTGDAERVRPARRTPTAAVDRGDRPRTDPTPCRRRAVAIGSETPVEPAPTEPAPTEPPVPAAPAAADRRARPATTRAMSRPRSRSPVTTVRSSRTATQSAGDCATINAFQKRMGDRARERHAGPTTMDVASRIAGTDVSAVPGQRRAAWPAST